MISLMLDTSRIAPWGLCVSSSRAFRDDSSSQQGTILSEVLRSHSEPYSLARLRGDFVLIRSLMKQAQRFIESVFGLAQLIFCQHIGARALRQPNCRECLFHFRVDSAFG